METPETREPGQPPGDQPTPGGGPPEATPAEPGTEPVALIPSAASEIVPSAELTPAAPVAEQEDELETEEADEEEESRPTRRVRVRTRTNWVLTGAVGLGMLILGGLIGFLVNSSMTQPSLAKLAALQSSLATATAVAAAQPPAASAGAQPTPDMKAILALVVSKTRHFKGDANAPVTMIEFSDFQ